MKIRELDQETTEKIAAGEVIENPASVVKELVENALDAGAGIIDLTIEGGGKKKITITDNGHGVETSDLSLAFKRFATSKIRVIEDLQGISSLGFRGEALASIAAVAKVRMTTRSSNALAGSQITLSGGKEISREEVGAPIGTRIEVSGLFFNTPGRQKFLRADSVETSRISALLTELSLANPGVAFSLKSGSRILLETGGDGSLIHVIGALYGNETAAAMREIKGADKNSGIVLAGYTTAPLLTRSSRRWITLTVNGRLIRSPLLVNALERGYGDYLPNRRHPVAVINIVISPERIDINVHPSKIEVRFREPEAVKSLIYRAVKLTLSADGAYPVLQESSFKSAPAPGFLLDSSRRREDQQQGLNSLLKEETTFNTPTGLQNPAFSRGPLAQSTMPGGEHCRYRLIGQFLDTYLVVQDADRLLLIDQHAAHERIIYHQLQEMKYHGDDQQKVQLTMPLTYEPPAAWRHRLDQLLPLLREYGFLLDPIGDYSYALRSVPFILQGNGGEKGLSDLLEDLLKDSDVPEKEWEQILLKTIACHRSIKAGQKLSEAEMKNLLSDWSKTPHAGYCPHGRPTVISFERPVIEKSFHRRGH